MSPHSPAHELASHIHASFFGQNGNLTEQEIRDSNVQVNPRSYPSRIPELTVMGYLDETLVMQRLTLGKTGMLYLTTSEFGEGGAVATMHISERPHPTNELDKVAVLMNSLFMKSLVEIALERG